MGQVQIKTGLMLQKHAQSLANGVTSNFSTASKLNSLTYEEFVHEIQLLNEILDELTKSREKTVHFSIATGPQKQFIWKISTKVACEKVVRCSGLVISSKLLSVRRFIRLYADIMHQISAVSDASADPAELQASMIIDRIDHSSTSTTDADSHWDTDSLNECCICMERSCQLILPCTHGYCETCIENWADTFNLPQLAGSDSTCPLCRGPLDKAANHWVIPEAGVPARDEMPSLVLGLVDQVDGRSVPAPRPLVGIREEETEETEEQLLTSSTSEGYTLVSHSS